MPKDNLIAWLREKGELYQRIGQHDYRERMVEAADEIARLKGEVETWKIVKDDMIAVAVKLGEKCDAKDALIEEMVEGLRPFAKRADGYESFDGQHDFPDDFEVLDGFGTVLPAITVGHFRNIRTLIAKATEPDTGEAS
jgi:hypothetical protein